MPSTPLKPPIKQIQGQGHIDEFIRAQKSSPNDGGQRAHDSPLQRKRRINDDDDEDDDHPMVNATAAASAGTNQNPVLIQDTENESDANFGVYMLPVRQQSQDQSNMSKPARGSQSRRRARSPETTEVTEQVQPLLIYCLITKISVGNEYSMMTNSDQDHEEALDEKQQYEGEAEESSMSDFIDDEEADESDADDERERATTCEALRNRRKWKETEFECPLCADLRVVLRHLLRRR